MMSKFSQGKFLLDRLLLDSIDEKNNAVEKLADSYALDKYDVADLLVYMRAFLNWTKKEKSSHCSTRTEFSLNEDPSYGEKTISKREYQLFRKKQW